MKNMTKIALSALIFVTAGALNAGAADAVEKVVALGLKAAAVKPETGCNTMGSLGGRNLKTLLVSQENQSIAQALCCNDDVSFKSKHPRAYESLCKGTSTNKATQTLINNIDKKPDLACPALARLGRGLSSLTDAQKRKVCATCKPYFGSHPKAQEAVCSGNDESEDALLNEEGLGISDIKYMEEID